MNEIKIKDYESSDFQGLIRLLKDIYSSDITKATLEEHCIDDDHEILIASGTEDGNVYGCSFIEYKRDYVRDEISSYVTYVAVDPEARRMGIGRKLFAEIEKRAALRKCWCVELTSANYRTEAHAFYDSLGFTKKKTTLFIKEV